MMNTTYRFHPGEYELGENEKFYGDMEARGWRLVERGSRLSKFTRTEPNRARYRIEVCAPGFLEEQGLSEGQLAVFTDCGWEHVDSQSFLHIFRAPEGSDAPEFYMEPAQQAATLKKPCRDIWWSGAITLGCIALLVLLFTAVKHDSISQWFAETVKRFVQAPTVYGFYLFWVLWGFYRLIWSTWKITRTYFQLKRGKPLDHNPKGRRLLHKLLNRGLLCLATLCILGTGVQFLLLANSRDLPPEPDGPYIVLRDLGWDGERTTLFYRDKESSITFTRSPLTDYWETFEAVEGPGGGTVWMYQYVYRLRIPAMADRLAWALMEDSVFARSADHFKAVDIPGLDAAWVTGGLEAVALKGNLVIYLEFLAEGSEEIQGPDALTAVAARWNESKFGG